MSLKLKGLLNCNINRKHADVIGQYDLIRLKVPLNT